VNAQEMMRRYDAGERSFGRVDLRGAKLREARLPEVDLRDADLTGATLEGSDLGLAQLSGANLRSADLRRANLAGADLNGALLRNADLRGADLTGARLARADLTRAGLKDCLLGNVILGGTYLIDLDLDPLIDASPVPLHHAPSFIDHTAILASVRNPRLKDFLLRSGMPGVFVEYMVDCARSLRDVDVREMLQSTFISYGHPDEAFARRLHSTLSRHGVTTFFYPEHAVPGEKLHRLMRAGVNSYDRVVLVCSRSSLGRRGVLFEIEEVLAREARDGGATYLIPIRLDDHVLAEWMPPRPDLAQAIRDRVVADFSGVAEDPDKFHAQVVRLLGALKKGAAGV
jgi:TIR domain/Pentapeptide repeats (8 copies)